MNETILIPGGRAVTATLDTASEDGDAPSVEGSVTAGATDTIVVACPPHPQHQGHRGDRRLTATSEELTGRGIDCLRIDYGEWDHGYGESTDVDNAVGWAVDRYEHVGLFGFSFGGTLSLVAARARPCLDGVSALAPTARINVDIDAVDALETLEMPIQVIYGTRDSVAEWEPIVEAGRERADAGLDVDLVEYSADHLFVGQTERVATDVGEFFERTL